MWNNGKHLGKCNFLSLTFKPKEIQLGDIFFYLSKGSIMILMKNNYFLGCDFLFERL